MRNAVIAFCDSADAAPYLTSLGNEVVVWIDDRSAVSSFSYVTFAMASLQQYSRHQGAYRLKTKSRALTIEWQGKQVLCTASLAGLPSSNCANPQPPVEAYLPESLTMN